MNETAAFVERRGGVYIPMVRLPHYGEARPVLGKGGNPMRFTDAYSAQRAASDAVCVWINGNLVRDGERLLDHRQAAEAIFRGSE